MVVGSGFIGCEAAASLAMRGVAPPSSPRSRPAGRPARRVGRAPDRRVAGGAGRRRCARGRGRARRGAATGRLDDGTTLEPDLVVVAVGVEHARPFLAVVRAARSRRAASSVDRELRTSDPRVWAAGDVARAHHAVVERSLSVEHWGDALSMGELAGRNAARSRSAAPSSRRPGRRPARVLERDRGAHAEVLRLGRRPTSGRGRRARRGAFTVWYADGGRRARRGADPRGRRRLRARRRPAGAARHPGRGDTRERR